MSFILNLVLTSLEQVGLSLLHNWPYLLAGILIAALLKRYVDAGKVSGLLMRFRGAGVVAATVAAVATPLCSCGTTAVVLGMMASTMPWAPIVAFMVASPLTSPEELVYSAGLFGWPFALTFFLASIFLGLAGGIIATWFENMGWLKNQARFAASTPGIHQQPVAGCGCSTPAAQIQPAAQVRESGPVCGCNTLVPLYAGEARLVRYNDLQPVSPCACDGTSAANIPASFQPVTEAGRKAVADGSTRAGSVQLLKDFYNSAWQLLPMFLGFAFVGYFLNGLIPASWIAAVFGGGNIYSVPLAATLGLPLYINTEGSLPLVRALLDHGMSQGAALAFMISGAGSSIGAVAGALSIARWRVVALVIAVLWIGAIFSGYVFDLLLALKVF